ncbi:MAG: hypothetical protein LBH16_01000 [Treponema sp.]|jgi:hypothetical protein|nr:hypothetical protein [Treponema sp.]
MKTTKNKEALKIITAMETLGYQVDLIEIQPETGFYLTPGRCLINIKASPLIEISCEENPSKSPE